MQQNGKKCCAASMSKYVTNLYAEKLTAYIDNQSGNEPWSKNTFSLLNPD